MTTGKVGDPYATSQLTIKGYTFKQLASDSAPIYGQYQKDTQVVTYIYSKIDTGGGDDGGKTLGTGGQGGDEQPTTPTNPTKPSQPGQGGGTATSPVETPTGDSQTAKQARLPQTDEDTGLTSMLLTILGVTLLGIAAVSYRKLRD
ncbi:MAG: MucBP domain-containing protein [Schleiferilactobacillus perolens]|uniref:MucBP domain-containing protein n=1 Tax=Schleiferilactobacillus perolens TaxID=100468 RepID=UPI0039EC22DA